MFDCLQNLQGRVSKMLQFLSKGYFGKLIIMMNLVAKSGRIQNIY